ncbi:MAG: hypothetical protein WC333_06390 [Dehalococcoidia bacterium]
MYKETDPLKMYKLNKFTRRTYWTASFAILIGLAFLAISTRSSPGILAGAVESSPGKLASSLGISGIILGFISLILAITARITATTARERGVQISFAMAKSGFGLSVVTIIVIAIALVIFICALIDVLPNYT